MLVMISFVSSRWLFFLLYNSDLFSFTFINYKNLYYFLSTKINIKSLKLLHYLILLLN